MNGNQILDQPDPSTEYDIQVNSNFVSKVCYWINLIAFDKRRRSPKFTCKVVTRQQQVDRPGFILPKILTTWNKVMS